MIKVDHQSRLNLLNYDDKFNSTSFRYNLVVFTLLRQRNVLIVSLVAPQLFNWWAYQYRWAKLGTSCLRSQRVTLWTAAPPEAVLCMCGGCPSASAHTPVALTLNTWTAQIPPSHTTTGFSISLCMPILNSHIVPILNSHIVSILNSHIELILYIHIVLILKSYIVPILNSHIVPI